MRLTRRRRRSLHDLDVGNASYSTFEDANRTDNARELDAWLEDINANARQTETRERRTRFDPSQRRIVDALGADPPFPRRFPRSAVWQDTLQFNRRIPDTTLVRFNDPNEARTIVQSEMRRQMQEHIERQYPGSVSEWVYAFDIARSALNQETNITLTARRH